MSHREQIEAFSLDLDALVERYRAEFELTYSDVVGTLQIKVWLMCREAAESQDEP